MLFNSLHFLWFFAGAWLLYWLLVARRKAQNVLLLVASYWFYGYWDWRFLGLIFGSTVLDYFLGLAFERPGLTPRGRRAIIWASVVVNLGALGLFKYYGFFVESLRELLHGLGLQADFAAFDILLPVGISFYTFQTLSYTIDRYRNQVPVERDFVDFALFVSFFPQLVAGPIVRAADFLPQGKQPRRFTFEDQADGMQLVLWGLFKKAVVADNLAPVVEAVFGNQGELGYLARLVGIYAFCAQIYCDFSGYSDIARGTARMLGFSFPLNFIQPYFSRDPSAFWRRWHVSLSTWLRDYLYIGLGGNRSGERRTYVNLLATMVLGGLWHGAAWNFVLWGAYQGLLLVGHRLWVRARGPRPVSRLAAALQWFVFFQLVCLGWLLFRSGSLAQIASFLVPCDGSLLAGLDLSEDRARGIVLGGFGCLVVLLWDLALERAGRELPEVARSPWARAGLLTALYLAISLFGRFHGDEFIYFQF